MLKFHYNFLYVQCTHRYVSLRIKLAGFKPQADKIVESIKKELSANIEEVDKRIAGGDENATFGNVGYHKRQADDLRARLEDLVGEHELPRGNLTPSHLEEVISLKTPEKRAEAIASILKNSSSVANTREKMLKLKRDEEKEAAFKKAFEKSEHQNCPICKAIAEETAWEGLPWLSV